MLYAVGFVALAFCVLVALDMWISADERQENSYASLADADRDGAITRGWIPGFLPESSRDIHEVHDLSPSTVWCAFQFDPRDDQKLRKNLKAAGAIFPRQIHIPSAGVRSWPRVLKGDLRPDEIRKAGYTLYVTSDPLTYPQSERLLFAIDWSNGRGYYYGH